MTQVKIGPPHKPLPMKRNKSWEDKDVTTHFFITVIETKIDTPEEIAIERSHRCWGYEPTFEKAEEAILNNYTDLHECSYQWAVIEEHVMSYFAMTTGFFQWYHWDKDKEAYERCDQPKWASNVCNWGIG